MRCWGSGWILVPKCIQNWPFWWPFGTWFWWFSVVCFDVFFGVFLLLFFVTFWCHFGVFWWSFGGQKGGINSRNLDLFEDPVWGAVWLHFGTILGAFWKDCGNIPGTFWEVLEHGRGSSLVFPGGPFCSSPLYERSERASAASEASGAIALCFLVVPFFS